MRMTKALVFIAVVILLTSSTIIDVKAQSMISKSNKLSINFKNGLPDTGPLPKIKWISPAVDYSNSTSSKVEVQVAVEASCDIKSIQLIIGNVKDGSTLGTKSFPVVPGKSRYDITTEVFLPDGSNFLSLQVITAQDVVVDEQRQIVTGKDAGNELISLNRKDRVLLFATDKYDNWEDLANPIDDAHAIARELKEKYGFEVDMVENPTVEQIWEKLREYNLQKFSPQDQLLIFFAGHGHFDESFGEGFVVAKNSLKNDVSRTTYLSHNRLRGVISNIPCPHILLTMDVCFGGTLDPVIARSRSLETEISVDDMLVRKWSHRTRKYLTSGAKEYVSDGLAGKHSPFAEKLIESLRSFGGDDRVLTLTELKSNLEKLKQLPRFGSFGDDEALSDFVFVGKR
jgi:hypothetical protein